MKELQGRGVQSLRFGEIPGEGHGKPLPFLPADMEKPMDREAHVRGAADPREVAKKLDTT